MTTQFHALRLSSKITDAVVNFSKTHSVGLKHSGPLDKYYDYCGSAAL